MVDVRRPDISDADLRRYVETMDENERLKGPIKAEVVAPFSGRWHIVEVVRGQEGIVAAHLVARWFGFYSPTFLHHWVSRGRKHSRRFPLVPGHIFVFVWDVRHHWRRIRSIPGVLRILTRGETPIVVEDKAIAEMLEIELREDVKGRRRRRNRSESEPQSVDVASYNRFHGIEELDSDERIDLFRKAMGLTS